MKVGDKLKYKGGMNPEWSCYEHVTFDKEYEIVENHFTHKSDVTLRLAKDLTWSFNAKQINSMFTPLTESKDAHYDNTNGSLYLFANQHELNAYEFDAIKRIVRCRKKGQFREDLEKTIRVIELYLKEME